MPVCYSIHGFGGSHRSAWRRGPWLQDEMASAVLPRMVHVFLDASCPLGHHEFADSVNNGPWGRALVEELIPALEREYAVGGSADSRFLTGHSSGGWSSLWLQITYPDAFGGTWSTAPDPVDFRDFTGVNIYADENAYADAAGEDIPLIRRNEEWVATIREFCTNEFAQQEYGGQFASFNAVFSPRADDGRPMRLFDVETGAIDHAVAEAWRRYDIREILAEHWATLGPKLAGKLHVYCGLEDTFRLEGATRLLQEQLEALGSDAEVLLVEGRDHGNLFAPHPELWPEGMLVRIYREMAERYRSR
jgi:S-formylglutathione hydrolase FrmB